MFKTRVPLELPIEALRRVARDSDVKRQQMYSDAPSVEVIETLEQSGASVGIVDTAQSNSDYFIRHHISDEDERFEAWNWLGRKHHSTFIVFPDDTYIVDVVLGTQAEAKDIWSLFLLAATNKRRFRLPKSLSQFWRTDV
jgi:hypothetical protein